MDLFDLGTYFASYVPVKARENPLLKYAAVACAAKALARVQGRRPSIGSRGTRQAQMERYFDAQFIDWNHKAAVYYDNAVTLLLQALKMDSTGISNESECEHRGYNGDLAFESGVQAPKRRRTSTNSSFVSGTDELLAASAILCVYESMDTSVSEWAKHLNGAKSLLVMTQERFMLQQMPSPCSSVSSMTSSFMSKARKATFWNIARQDMLAACKCSIVTPKDSQLTLFSDEQDSYST